MQYGFLSSRTKTGQKEVVSRRKLQRESVLIPSKQDIGLYIFFKLLMLTMLPLRISYVQLKFQASCQVIKLESCFLDTHVLLVFVRFFLYLEAFSEHNFSFQSCHLICLIHFFLFTNLDVNKNHKTALVYITKILSFVVCF